jgi:catechol 2,3-dioxygenase-like lactoylglutathione lyase family enzyme
MAAPSKTALSLSVDHLGVVVPDVDAALAWYKEILDFHEELQYGFPEAGVKIAFLVNGAGLRLEVMERSGSAPSPDQQADVFGTLQTQGTKHIAFLVDDIEATAQELKRRGATFIQEPSDVPMAHMKGCFIRDPGGSLIEFVQRSH